jgi:hypothetical protein
MKRFVEQLADFFIEYFLPIIFILAVFIITVSCAASKPQPEKPGKPRYIRADDVWLNQWLDSEHPRKVTPTGKRKRKKVI